MRDQVLLFFLALFLITASNTMGAEARAASSSRPDGSSNWYLYYDSVSGDELYSDGKELAPYDMKVDAKAEANVGILRYAKYYDVGKYAMTSQLLMPFGKKTVKMKRLELGIDVDDESKGLGDFTFIEGLWLKKDQENREWFGPLLYLTMPTGEYEKGNKANLGKNRYGAKFELLYGKGFWKNHQIEVAGAVEMFSENKDEDLKRKPLYYFDVHYSKVFSTSNLFAVDYFYTKGGLEGDKEEDNHSIRGELTGMISKTTALTLRYQKDLEVEDTFKTDKIELRIIYMM